MSSSKIRKLKWPPGMDWFAILPIDDVVGASPGPEPVAENEMGELRIKKLDRNMGGPILMFS